MSIFSKNDSPAAIRKRLEDLEKGISALQVQRSEKADAIDAAVVSGADVDKLFAAVVAMDANITLRQGVVQRVRAELDKAVELERVATRGKELTAHKKRTEERLGALDKSVEAFSAALVAASEAAAAVTDAMADLHRDVPEGAAPTANFPYNPTAEIFALVSRSGGTTGAIKDAVRIGTENYKSNIRSVRGLLMSAIDSAIARNRPAGDVRPAAPSKRMPSPSEARLENNRMVDRVSGRPLPPDRGMIIIEDGLVTAQG